MPLESPKVHSPCADPVIHTNTRKITLSGTIPYQASSLCYRYACVPSPATAEVPESSFSEYTSEGVVVRAREGLADYLPWSLDMRALPSFDAGQTMLVEVVSVSTEGAGEVSHATRISVVLSEYDALSLSSPVPSGIVVSRGSTSVSVGVHELMEGTFLGSFVGYNFYVSLTRGGGLEGYSRANRDYISTPSRTVKVRSTGAASTSEVDGLEVTTKVTNSASYPLYEYVLDKDALNRLVDENLLPNVSYTEDTIFYFVCTTVLYDAFTGQLEESSYSPEVAVSFISFASEYRELPSRGRDDVALAICRRVASLSRRANVLSGNVYRDLVDPVAEEFAHAYVIQDFHSRCQSIDGLVALDDEDADGVSDPVSSSLTKKRLQLALGLDSEELLQGVIDSAFDKKADNVSLSRTPPTFAVGEVVFHTSDVPAGGLAVDEGAVVLAGSAGTSVKFRVTSSYYLYYSEKASYYNASAKRYELICEAEAEVTGVSGNVGVGAISVIQSGADSRWRVTNVTPFFGGSSKETNYSLATRVKLANAGLDSGSAAGYTLAALGVPGVRKALVVQAGDDMMLRDMDPSTGSHIGGKVDIYVQGSRMCQWQDTFSFSYAGPTGASSGERFFVEDAEGFLLRTDSSAVTVDTPIIELMRVTNQTKGVDYDPSGALVGVGDGDSVILAQNSTNLAIGMSSKDIIEVDYRYRGYNSYTLRHQPVESIVSVTGDVDGKLPVANYRLVKLENPLQNGRSTAASDGVELLYSGGLPTGRTVQVSDEHVTVVKGAGSALNKKGVDIDTIQVFADAARADRYTRDLDYRVVRGGDQGSTVIALTPASRIRSGSVVHVWYQASQNFTVVYSCNRVLENVLSAASAGKHACADVAVKQAVGNHVDIYVRLARKSGTSESAVASKVVNRLASFVNNLSQGESLYADDVASVVRGTEGVRTVFLPLTRMRKANGSFILNDSIWYTDFVPYGQEGQAGVVSYISVDPVLSYGTTEGGGPENLFRAIAENGIPLIAASSPLSVSDGAGRGYIRGDGRIIVSTRDGMPPQTKSYSASYYTYVAPEEDFAADIKVEAMEYLTIGSTSITVDASTEDTRSR